jgi:TolB protein
MDPGAAPPAPPSSEPPAGAGRRLTPGPVLAVIAVILIAATAVVGAAVILPGLTGGAASPQPSGLAIGSGVGATPSGLAVPSATTVPSGSPSSSASPGPPLASAGAIAVVGNDGSLSLVDAAGRSTVLSPPGEAVLGFPVWSPDGTRIAAIRSGPEHAILVFDVRRAASGQSVEPVVIFRSAVIGPFYLSWTPDGRVSFLAEESGGLALRVAPADGSAPLDGTGPGGKIRSGNPFYFDWIDRDRLLAHVGTGSDAFLGEIGLDGTSVARALKTPGDFRSAVVSHDRRRIGYVRMGASGAADVVVAARDGSSEHTMSVFGSTALVFDPTGDTVASIGPSQPSQTAYSVPLGPLRLIDARSGKVRTLLDGSVVSFWWSPDGATMAALRVQPIAGIIPALSPISPASAAPSPVPQATEVRLLFVDVASGEIRSQRVVQPGELFIGQFLTYFDQYALSHRLWAPDSSSLLLPVADRDGTTRIAIMPANGDPVRTIEGAIGFWSP